MRILLLGSIGSGKSTQAQILASDLGFAYVRSGDLVREKAKEASPEGQICKQALESGRLAPDEIVAKMVREKLEELGLQKGIIFDGYIRRLSQLEVFDPHYDKVVYLKLPEEVVRERLLKRAHQDDRVDDAPAVIEERLRVYHQQTEPLIKYFQKQGSLDIIEANGTVEQVTKAIENHFSQLRVKVKNHG